MEAFWKENTSIEILNAKLAASEPLQTKHGRFSAHPREKCDAQAKRQNRLFAVSWQKCLL